MADGDGRKCGKILFSAHNLFYEWHGNQMVLDALLRYCRVHSLPQKQVLKLKETKGHSAYAHSR